MRSQFFLLSFLLVVWPAWTASSSRKAPAASAKTSKKSSSAKSSSARRSATTWRNRQLRPSQERYSEIQRALVDKGYLQSDPDGNWDAASVAALRKFQQDHNLQPSGKIDSLSLIALGLGPKYETAKAPSAPPPTAP